MNLSVQFGSYVLHVSVDLPFSLSFWQWLLLFSLAWSGRYLTRRQKNAHVIAREAQQYGLVEKVSGVLKDMKFRRGRLVRLKTQDSASVETQDLDAVWARLLVTLAVLWAWMIEAITSHRTTRDPDNER